MIRLKETHGTFGVGSVVELQGEVENTLIGMGKAEKCEGPVKIVPIPDPAKAEPEAKPVKLSPGDALRAVLGQVQAARQQFQRGSKSDNDQLGARFSEIEAKIQASLDQDYPQSKAAAGATSAERQSAEDQAQADQERLYQDGERKRK